MAKKMRLADGRTFNLTMLVDDIINGRSLPTSLPPEVCERAKRLAARERRADSVTTLYGRVVRQTEKAVLFRVAPAWNGVEQPLFGEVWLPLSQVTVYEGSVGPVDSVTIPAWLVNEKKN